MSTLRLDGSRVRQFLGAEVDALLATYDQFANLVPSATGAGAAHRGEDGRFVEALLRSYLRKFLPADLEVATGFVLRPAVKTGHNGRERKGERDSHSSQLDIIVFDRAEHPVFQRFEESVVVPPEAVIAVLSIKKHLRARDIADECTALRDVARLCECLDVAGLPRRGPFLALLGVTLAAEAASDPAQWMFDRLTEAYPAESKPSFDEVVGVVGTLREVSVFKARPSGTPVSAARFVAIEQRGESERHLGLQTLLTGIMSVYYDSSRSTARRPGFSAFEPGRNHDRSLGEVPVHCLRYGRDSGRREPA